jgi:hypothetical protein
MPRSVIEPYCPRKVTIEWYDGPRAELADLFALADDSRTVELARLEPATSWCDPTALDAKPVKKVAGLQGLHDPASRRRIGADMR